MDNELSIPEEFQSIYRTGENLERDLDAYLQARPVDPKERQNSMELLRDRAHLWFNLVGLRILPHTTYDSSHLNLLLRRALAAVGLKKFHEEYSYTEILYDYPSGGQPPIPRQHAETRHNVEVDIGIEDARAEVAAVMAAALRLVRTVPSPITAPRLSSTQPKVSHIPNTAFILMWMDKAHPELIDVHEAVKEVFAEFGVRARRADEIQHQDRITDLVLEQIACSEFLFADLSGERPNVYYEIGYAHGLGKRPILYRRKDTPLHFDLSVHNVPDYANVTELRKMLRERLAALTGRSAHA